MNDTIKPGGSAVASHRLLSGARVKDEPRKTEKREPERAVDSVVNEVGKAKESVEKLSSHASIKIEVIKQNETASKTRVEDVDEAVRLAKDLQINIRSRKQEASGAHDLDSNKAKELLK